MMTWRKHGGSDAAAFTTPMGTSSGCSMLAFESYASRFLDSVRKALSNPDQGALDGLFKGVIANMTEATRREAALTTIDTEIELPPRQGDRGTG